MNSQLTSAQNPRLQEIRKAIRSGRALANGTIPAEGPHLIEEASGSCWRVEEILGTEDALRRFSQIVERAQTRVITVSERAFDSIAATENSQGLLALLRPRRWNWDDLFHGTPLVIVLDAIQDPGNIGTIIRSAEAFGASGVVLMEGCARLSNGKLMRASAGSLFRLPCLDSMAFQETITELNARCIPLYALAAAGESPLNKTDLRHGCALSVGNEGAGISERILKIAGTVCIPTARVESLNVGVACSIALFEAARQRASG